ncbi:MAG: GSCFA domain-containing protein [Fibrobacterales bacterium]
MTQPKLTTPVSVKKPGNLVLLSPGDQISSMGSCFAEHLTNDLKTQFWPVLGNPTGITYNPLSIAQSLQLTLDQTPIEPNNLFYHNELWSHFDFHGDYSHPSAEGSCNAMNSSLFNFNTQLLNSKLLIISLGTAFGYFFKGIITNNCHKLNNSLFERRLITIDEGTSALTSALSQLLARNLDIHIVFTVSPVRHLRDKPSENSLSKATLRHICHNLTNTFNQQSSYFPSFEIMMDELRDYRFYDASLTHPNELAISIILDRFIEAYFNSHSGNYFREVTALLKSVSHKPRNPKSLAFTRFQESMQQKIANLKQRYPELHIFI